ncbi:MAG TPA: flagellar basal-body MS-ring/collar protein FliF [Candidatus Sulfotelmatobacter sp.]|nr:flagellar basal-body MS-ring/collar protein FliF [Candidatus Sulfotelmatobacter sp.]
MDQLSSSFAAFTGRFREWWNGQSPSTRLGYGAVVLALVIGVAIFGAFRLRGPAYAVLFSNLPADEANAVLQKLDAEKIPHRLADGGTTVLVPEQDVAEQRVELAGENVVKGGGTGWELFDRTNLGMTDFQEKIAKERAVEGELERTISGLSEVQSARVHIASPEASLYSTSQLPTTASVAIVTKPGMQLDAAQVRGVTQLVAGAVDGLKPENVTLVDQNGTILRPAPLGATADGSTGDDGASALRMTQDQLVAKEKFESDLQENLQGLLDNTLGAHHSAVRVASEMNFDANSTETKQYAPQGTVRSQQTERESYNGTGTPPRQAGGVPGTTTNVVPTYQGTQQQQGNSRYTHTKNTTNYEITETDGKHVDAPGKVTRLSVAVLVNVPATAPAGANAPYTVAPADVTKIRNVIAAAAGIDPARGDQISVEAIPFAPVPNAVGYGPTSTTVLGIPLVPALALLAILGVIGAGAAFALVRRRTFRPSAELPTFDSTLAEELPSFEEHPMLDGTPSIAAPIRSAADLTREQMIEYVTTVAQENPDNIAKLVKLWLAE